MKRLLMLPGVLLGFVMFANTGMAQDDPETNELRERITATAREMKEAEQSGRKELVEELRRRAEELKKALLSRRPAGFLEKDPAGPIPPEKRMQLMKEKLEQLRREGQAEKAEQLQAEIERFMARSKVERGEAMARAKAEAAERKAREMRERAQRGPGAPPPEELERRLHHLRTAIDNLHAAGMPDQAEMLVRIAEELRQQLERQGPPPGPMPEFQELRQHVEMLTDRVRKLEETVERLQREPR